MLRLLMTTLCKKAGEGYNIDVIRFKLASPNILKNYKSLFEGFFCIVAQLRSVSKFISAPFLQIQDLLSMLFFQNTADFSVPYYLSVVIICGK